MIRSDLLLALVLALLAAFHAAGLAAGSSLPFEDAAMLMRYALHLAHGHGIVWNIGEPPVDGATDFLFMVVLAGLVRLGATIEGATRGLLLVSHAATVALVVLAVRRLHGAPRWMAAASGAFLVLGPGASLIAAYFGTPFFTLAVAVTWLFAVRAARSRGPQRTGMGSLLAFPIAALIMSLIRPEGVLLAGFMLVAVVFARGWREAKPLVTAFAGVFLAVGGAYLAWRWSYFGGPLPNPFIKKGGGVLHVDSLNASFSNLSSLTAPLWIPLVLAARSRAALRSAAFALLPVLGFGTIWILLSNENNVAARFQYPVLPILLISWPAMVSRFGRDLRQGWPARVAGLVAIGVAVGLLLRGRPLVDAPAARFHHDGRYDAALVLRAHEDRDYTLATSEAGLLPLYSGWRAIDTWGLNDPSIAHHGSVTEEMLDRRRPEVIMFHGYFSPAAPRIHAAGDPWSDMLQVLKDYAEERGYVLAAAYGPSPGDTHHYYVRPDFPESGRIVEELRRIDYRWYENGETCLNYVQSRPAVAARRSPP
jgi:hypothetical protein